MTRRIYALTDEQQLDLVNFLLSEAGPSAQSPLPILGGAQNLRRVDPEISIPKYNIFRDRWERKVFVSSFSEYLETRSDVEDIIDHPEQGEKAGSKPGT